MSPDPEILSRYPVIVLDCDGVILDSNQLKTDAMGETVAEYGDELVTRFVRYHQENGGISRYEKLEIFLRDMADDWSVERYDYLLNKLSHLLREKLLTVAYTDGAIAFLERASASVDLYIVSGGDQAELRWAFAERGASGYFEAILGSPTTKHIHCESIRQTLAPQTPVLFIGDSRLDHEAARDNGFDFLFLSGYTEFDGWQAYCRQYDLPHVPDFTTLLKHPS